MLCDLCCKHMHREISMLEGKCVNLMAYGCEGDGCDYRLRQRLDDYHADLAQKAREERNKKVEG